MARSTRDGMELARRGSQTTGAVGPLAVVPPARIERATCRLGGGRSAPLSYEGIPPSRVASARRVSPPMIGPDVAAPWGESATGCLGTSSV